MQRSKLVLSVCGFAVLFGVVSALVLTFDIPEVSALENYRPPVMSRLFAADGTQVHQFAQQKRLVVELDEIPEHLRAAIIATEDSRFYDHFGIDIWGVARAMHRNVVAGRFAQGASTLTQQLARVLFLNHEKTLRRKLQEALLALQIEKTYTKDEILEFYCNQIYLGHGRYGMEAASRHYFGKPLRDVDLSEAAVLAGVVQRPSSLSPLRHPDAAIRRRNHVLSRMVSEGYITAEHADAAREQSLVVNDSPPEPNPAPYFVEEVRRYVVDTYGEKALYEAGLDIYTTLDVRMQRGAVEALRGGLLAIDRRRGWRDEIERVDLDDPGLELDELLDVDDPVRVGDLRKVLVTEGGSSRPQVQIGTLSGRLVAQVGEWAGNARPNRTLKRGDVVWAHVRSVDLEAGTFEGALSQLPEVQGAAALIDAASGEVRALVGGFDFAASQFNRATQARRQPGSVFKPFVYAAALEQGITLADRMMDEPTAFVDRYTSATYQPENHTRRYYGMTTVRQALEQSRNIASVKLLNLTGYQAAIDTARRMGVTSPLQPYPSLALGSFELGLLELTSAYTAFPNRGLRVGPHLIRSIVSRDGDVLEQARPHVVEAIAEPVAYAMTSALQGVVEEGTAKRARRLERPLAGKTGTTDDYTDAWYVGFSPRLVGGVWVGLDEKQRIGRGETGARAALPIWIDMMEVAVGDRPPERFPSSTGVVLVPIDRDTGLRTSLDTGCPHIVLEVFLEGTEPVEYCSDAEHYRHSLPYFLQDFPLTDDHRLAVAEGDLMELVGDLPEAVRLQPYDGSLTVDYYGFVDRVGLQLRADPPGLRLRRSPDEGPVRAGFLPQTEPPSLLAERPWRAPNGSSSAPPSEVGSRRSQVRRGLDGRYPAFEVVIQEDGE